jgi:hypothetical protein
MGWGDILYEGLPAIGRSYQEAKTREDQKKRQAWADQMTEREQARLEEAQRLSGVTAGQEMLERQEATLQAPASQAFPLGGSFVPTGERMPRFPGPGEIMKPEEGMAYKQLPITPRQVELQGMESAGKIGLAPGVAAPSLEPIGTMAPIYRETPEQRLAREQSLLNQRGQQNIQIKQMFPGGGGGSKIPAGKVPGLGPDGKTYYVDPEKVDPQTGKIIMGPQNTVTTYEAVGQDIYGQPIYRPTVRSMTPGTQAPSGTSGDDFDKLVNEVLGVK